MSPRLTALHARMVAAVLALAFVTVALLVGVWLVFFALFIAVDPGGAAGFATLFTALTLVVIGYLEYSHLETIERFADATPVAPSDEPELYRTVTKVAALLSVPVPMVALADRDAPEAMAVGFRSETVHLVLSRGTLEALETAAELEAVIAHELAHVRNRDAMVMTAVSTPVVLAGGLRSRIESMEEPGVLILIVGPLWFVSSALWVVGRTITARLSRARERVADRAAAEATGSPAALASALRRLDGEIADTPNRDLRAVSGVSSLSILPLEPRELEKVMLGPRGDVEPSFWWLRKRLHRLERRLFGSHPPTEERLAALSSLERERSGR